MGNSILYLSIQMLFVFVVYETRCIWLDVINLYCEEGV